MIVVIADMGKKSGLDATLSARGKTQTGCPPKRRSVMREFDFEGRINEGYKVFRDGEQLGFVMRSAHGWLVRDIMQDRGTCPFVSSRLGAAQMLANYRDQ